MNGNGMVSQQIIQYFTLSLACCQEGLSPKNEPKPRDLGEGES